MKTDRRTFVVHSAITIAGAASTSMAMAMAGPVTDEKDPKAVALGYRDDANKVDASKYPNYAKGQVCANCSNFRGSPGIAAGPCPRMPKAVLATGWCSDYAKKN